MPAERYYIPDNLEAGSQIALEGQEYHHLANVMRGRIGDEVELVNGLGLLATASIDALEKKRAVLSISNVLKQDRPKQSLIIAQGMPRLNRLEPIIEKATELGATEIWLFPASRSEKKSSSDNQIERLQAIAIAAMKQCGRLFLPKIVLLPPIKQWQNLPANGCFFGDLRPKAVWFADALAQHPSHEIVVCIGPESGLTDEETHELERKGFIGVKIHPNILRSDTAAIAALSIASHLTHKLI